MTSSGAALWRGRVPVQGSRKCQDDRDGNNEMWLQCREWVGEISGKLVHGLSLGVEQRSVGEEVE